MLLSNEKGRQTLTTFLRWLVRSLLLITLPNMALAAPGWSPALTINTLRPEDQFLTLVVTGNNNPFGCSVSNWLRIHPGDANYSLISSAILTALRKENL